jgi:hypothetical protein
MTTLFLDLRWLREGSLRGIGSVSLAYAKFILQNDSKNKIYLITTNKSKPFLKEFIKLNRIQNGEVITAPIIFGDLFQIALIIKRYHRSNSPPKYVGFGNTAIFDWSGKINQHIFIHDVSWEKSFRKEIGHDRRWHVSLYDFYMRLNSYLFHQYVSTFFFVSCYAFRSTAENSVYRCRSLIINNPITLDLPEEFMESTPQDLDEYSLCWVGGDAVVKNKQHIIDTLFIINDHLQETEPDKQLEIRIVGDVNLPKQLETKLPRINLINCGVVSHNEMCSIIRSVRTLIVPSITESFSIPAIIANHFRKNIVGTINSPFNDWFGDNYLPITTKDPAETASAIIDSFQLLPKAFKVVDFQIETQGAKLLDHLNDDSPIVVYHQGNQRYFRSAVNLMNKAGFQPVIISDDNVFKSQSIIFQLSEFKDPKISEKWKNFCKNYVHMHHDADPAAQLYCYERWFIILDKMKSLGVATFWHLDSDICVFSDFNLYKKQIEKLKCDCALSMPHQKNAFQMSASAHVSYWSIGGLADFIDFLIDSFETNHEVLNRKWDYLVQNEVSGGICDMTFLYLWAVRSTSNCNNNVIEINHVLNNTWSYNDNINISFDSNKFSMLDVKKVSGSYVVVGNNSKSKPLPFLHCQGRAKPLLILLDLNIPLKVSRILVLQLRKSIQVLRNLIRHRKVQREI